LVIAKNDREQVFVMQEFVLLVPVLLVPVLLVPVLQVLQLVQRVQVLKQRAQKLQVQMQPLVLVVFHRVVLLQLGHSLKKPQKN
jgi:hypothetical protein